MCSQLSGKKFCDCVNWKGVCIFQEYIWNGKKAKKERKTYKSTVLKKELVGKDIFLLTIGVTHKLAQDLTRPGSFVFLRKDEVSQFYDAPISIMEVNTEENFIRLVIEQRGVKTKTICDIGQNEKILVRGPFWNGVLGLKSLNKAKDKTSLIITRGIGQAPSVQVIKKLYGNGNKIIAIIDKASIENIFIKKYLDLYNVQVIESSTLSKGELTEELKNNIKNIMEKEELNLIHCAAQDIIIFKLLEFIDGKVKLTCCNNAKMCCGEGICGGCTARYKGHVVKRMCKVQTDPQYLFKERRLI